MPATLTPDRWERIKSVFQQVLELDSREWQTYLNSTCSDDPVVREELERLIAHHVQSSGFLDPPLSSAARLATEAMWRPTMFAAGDMVSGRFRIVRFIGKGGMGEVYAAEDLALDGTVVALKTIRSGMEIDDQLVAQFRVEVQIARRITHTNVCRIFDLYEHRVEDPILGGSRTIVFLSMEMLDGENLAERLARSGPMAPTEALPVVRDIVQGLDAAHQQRVIHRDLKASNVMLVARADGGQRAVLTDFGLACNDERDWAAMGLVGTPDYMAPEQLHHGTLTARTDIFALGVVLYEMVTGKRPFSGSSTLTGAVRRADSEPLPPSARIADLDPKWDRVIRRCLERDPAHRFVTVTQVLTELEDTGRTRRIARRSFVAATVGLAAGGAAWLWHGKTPPALPSLVVLPFQDLSGNEESAYIAGGLTDDLTLALSRVPQLRVVGRNSAWQIRDQKSIQEIGRRLRVASVLTGAVRSEGGRISVNARLTNVADGQWLWSGSYTEEATTLFRARTSLTVSIAGALQPRLPATQLAGLGGADMPEPEAYHLYLNARYEAGPREDANLKKSAELYEQAIARSPQFALAHAGVSEVYNMLAGRPDFPADEYFQKSEAAAQKALGIDPRLGEAHMALGLCYQRYRWDWDAAEQHFRTAVQLSPGAAATHHRYAGFSSNLGRHEIALKEIRVAQDLDPLWVVIQRTLGVILCRARRYDEALASFRHTLELYPGDKGALVNEAETLGAMGRWPEAIATFRELVSKDGATDDTLALLAHALARAGQTQEAREILARLEAAYDGRHSAVSIAYIYRGLGDWDRTFEWLERAVQNRENGIVPLKVDPHNDPLRSDPRFSKLLEQLRL